MTRGFLFGVGFWLVVAALFPLTTIWSSAPVPLWLGVVIFLVFLSGSALAIRAANEAPPHRSWPHAVGGWLLGYLAVQTGIGIPAFTLLAIHLWRTRFDLWF
jgi:hypothetical protein